MNKISTEFDKTWYENKNFLMQMRVSGAKGITRNYEYMSQTFIVNGYIMLFFSIFLSCLPVIIFFLGGGICVCVGGGGGGG